MGNVSQMQSSKYSNNLYGDVSEHNTQQEDNLDNQQLDSEQEYISAAPVAPNQYTHTQYSNQNQIAQMATYEQTDSSHDMPGPSSSSNLRRSSRPLYESSRAPHIGSSFSQSSIDHFDHYKRPPSRDSSVDRYARAASRLSGSRQPSIDRSILPSSMANNSNPSQNPADTTGTMDRNVRAGSAFRNITSVATSPVVPGQSGGFQLLFRP